MADSDFEKQNASSTASNQCFMLLQFFEKSRHESSLQFSNGILFWHPFLEIFVMDTSFDAQHGVVYLLLIRQASKCGQGRHPRTIAGATSFVTL